MDKIKTHDLFLEVPDFLKEFFNSCIFPWEMLSSIKEFILNTIKSGLKGFKNYSENVIVGKDVKIYPNVYIEGPCILGACTEVMPGAFIRGSVIAGDNCVLGNSSEFKNCILLNGVQAPHYNYVGDSILGSHVHLGAGTICSNLKGDKKAVVIHGEENYDTNIRKVGAILGDYVDIGSGSVLNPGTIIGRNTRVYPLNCLRGVYKENFIIKSPLNIVKNKDY